MTLSLRAPRHLTTPIRRIAIAACLLLMATLPSLHAPKAAQATVASNLMAEEGKANGMPIAGNNFARTAITIRHWNKAIVTVHIITSSDDKNAPAEEIEQVDRAVSLWNDRFKTVSLQRVDTDSADVNINFVVPCQLSGGAVGKTDALYNPENNELVRAAIHVSEKLSKDHLEQALCHELGHALGIQGHSDNKRDLMFPYAHLPLVITDRDVNTLAAGYYARQ